MKYIFILALAPFVSACATLENDSAKGMSNQNASENRGLQADFVKAIESGNLAEVRQLLDKGANVDAKDESLRTPLHEAVWCDNPDIVSLLIQHGADIDAKNEAGRTPLHFAAWKVDAKVIKLLVEAGAEIDIKDLEKETPLHNAANKGDLDIVEYLIDCGADVNAKDKKGQTPLHKVADYHTSMPAGCTSWMGAKAAKLLLERGAKPDAKDNEGMTPLHWAAQSHNDPLIDVLVSGRADINALNKNGETPLDRAIKESGPGHGICTLELLVKHGAKTEKIPMSVAIATKCRNISLAKELLKAGSDPNSKEPCGRTALHYAAERGDQEFVEILLKHGADVNIQSREKRTPLDVAKTGEIRELLRSRGAKRKKELQGKDK